MSFRFSLYSGLKLEWYTTTAKTFLEINLTFLIDLFIILFQFTILTGTNRCVTIF